jgi:hypothetical protein
MYLIFYRQICFKVHQYLLGPVLSSSRCLLITYLSRRSFLWRSVMIVSPSATTTTCIEELNEIISTNKVNNKKYDYLLYVGDFNFKEIDWENNNTNVGPEHLASKFFQYLLGPVLSSSRCLLITYLSRRSFLWRSVMIVQDFMVTVAQEIINFLYLSKSKRYHHNMHRRTQRNNINK